MPESDSNVKSSFAPRDLISGLAILIGFRDLTYRKEAVNLLQLKKGDQVVEIGCGTGRNFELLENAIGPSGKIFAVDISERMIDKARRRASRHGWVNIEFVLSDAAGREFPQSVDGFLSTYTLVIIPGYDGIIEKSYHTLKVGGRFVIIDQKFPDGPASLLVPLIQLLSRPIDYYRIVKKRRIDESLGRHFGNVMVKNLYGGFFYVAVSDKRIS